jgi:hypothetical protein
LQSQLTYVVQVCASEQPGPTSSAFLARIDRCDVTVRDATGTAEKLYDLTKAHTLKPGSYCCVAGEVKRADKLYLVIEAVKPDAKHNPFSIAPVPADGAGG